MKFEEIISSFVMVIVTGLVLVGFTIAWYTNNNLPAVTGLEILAAEMGSVQVALKPEAEGGVDISELEGDAKYAELGMAEYTNFNVQDKGELAPGVSGQVTFYVKPITSAVKACNIVPMVRIRQDGSTWYPVIESVDKESVDADDGDEGSENSGSEGSDEINDGSSSDEGNSNVEDTEVIEELYQLANAHIDFFTDAEMTQKITSDTPYRLTWEVGEGEDAIAPLTEQKATIYWKWHYEYPFTAEEESTLTAAQKKEKIYTYDEEDMKIGNNISEMKFYFTFSAQ